ncbi:adhesin [Neisseria sp. HMSC067H09]|nr:adhesin [Neisseria sp. HMSC055H02]OFS04318.1 adhesin [Neisseria sp. HMSC067H09]OFV30148.1 adhesin [Neisseria sp. HMSC15C08]
MVDMYHKMECDRYDMVIMKQIHLRIMVILNHMTNPMDV